MNLDDFNAAFAALGDEAERGQFLSGMSRGMNAGSFRESTQAFKDGFEVGHAMRQSAEDYRETKKKAGRLGGNPELTKAKDNHEVNHEDIQKVDQMDNHEVNHEPTTWINQSLILNPSNNTTPPAEPETKRKTRRTTPKIDWHQTLGDKHDEFFELFGAWPKGSKQRPYDAAKAYLEARDVASHECILGEAQDLVRRAKGHVVRLDTWLHDQCWEITQKEWE